MFGGKYHDNVASSVGDNVLSSSWRDDSLSWIAEAELMFSDGTWFVDICCAHAGLGPDPYRHWEPLCRHLSHDGLWPEHFVFEARQLRHDLNVRIFVLLGLVVSNPPSVGCVLKPICHLDEAGVVLASEQARSNRSQLRQPPGRSSHFTCQTCEIHISRLTLFGRSHFTSATNVAPCRSHFSHAGNSVPSSRLWERARLTRSRPQLWTLTVRINTLHFHTCNYWTSGLRWIDSIILLYARTGPINSRYRSLKCSHKLIDVVCDFAGSAAPKRARGFSSRNRLIWRRALLPLTSRHSAWIPYI